jgi:N-acetylglucosaminyldiphosphoundecaprenol N-acetyl-beta-D-mannosaminyltransferase
MVISQKDETYRNILNSADLVYADGMGIVWGARVSGYHLPGRSTGADFMPWFFKRFAEKGIKIYFLGSEPGVAEHAAKIVRRKNPAIDIVGTQHGFFDPRQSDKIIKEINNARPHILIVGMGVPYQEKWIEEHFEKIDVSVLWGIGAVFDFLSGKLPRGPQWLLDNGFEWLCRLLTEPRRLWRRYLLGNLMFTSYVLRWSFWTERIQHRPSDGEVN